MSKIKIPLWPLGLINLTVTGLIYMYYPSPLITELYPAQVIMYMIAICVLWLGHFTITVNQE